MNENQVKIVASVFRTFYLIVFFLDQMLWRHIPTKILLFPLKSLIFPKLDTRSLSLAANEEHQIKKCDGKKMRRRIRTPVVKIHLIKEYIMYLQIHGKIHLIEEYIMHL